jgi:hypothetical protein
VSLSKEKPSKKAKSGKVKGETYEWDGCIAVRGEGENRECLLIWMDDNLRESNWLPLRDIIEGVPLDTQGRPRYRLVLWQKGADGEWKELDVKHADIVDELTAVALED